MIVLENEVINEVWGHGPYERYLAAKFGNMSGMYAACHPSAPNYLAMVSSETLQCNSDNWYNYSAKTIGDALDGVGLSWRAYAENLPKTACAHPGSVTSGLFATKHVPFLYFAHVTHNLSFCHHHVLPSSSFQSSVAAGWLANLSFYTPNLCDDGHNGCGGNATRGAMTHQADTWLRGFLAPILNHTGAYASARERALVNHTAFVITWDEGLGSNLGYAVSTVRSGNTYAYCAGNGASGDAVCGGRVFTVVVSPYSVQRSWAGNDSHFGLVATVEWLFHLGHLNNPGNLDHCAGFPALNRLFSFTTN